MQHHCWVMLDLVKSEFLEEAISNVIFKNFEVGQKLEHFTTIEANGCWIWFFSDIHGPLHFFWKILENSKNQSSIFNISLLSF